MKIVILFLDKVNKNYDNIAEILVMCYNSQANKNQEGAEWVTRQEQALRSRQKIMDTAMLLIEEKGYANVTIKDICEKSGLSIGTFYHYFSNIAEILFTFYNQYDSMLEEGLAVHHYETWREEADYLCRTYLELTLKNGWQVSSAVISTQFRIEEKYLYREERFLNQKLRSMIEKGKACGDIRSDEETDQLCAWLLRSVRGAIFDWVMHDGKTDLMSTGIHDYSRVLDEMME